MNITFVLPFASLNGGIRVVAIYARLLAQRGHKITVVSTPRKVYGRRRRLVEVMRRTFGIPLPSYPSYFDGVPIPHRVIEQIRPVRDSDLPDSDIVVATWWETAEWVYELSPSKGRKVHLVQGHEIFPGQPLDRVRAAYRLPLYKITIAQWLVDVLRTDYGFDRVPLVPNAVDHEQFFAVPRGRQQQPTVGFLYSPGTVKGFDVIVKAMQRVQEAIPRVRLCVFGTARPDQDLSLPDGAEFTLRPAQDRIRQIYSGLDVWVCGSRSEGFHLMPLEAMACRTPVVSTRIGGAVETIEDGINGFLVPVEDWEALADRTLRVLRLDDASWRRMSEHAQSTAARFSWGASADQLERVLQKLVDGEAQHQQAAS